MISFQNNATNTQVSGEDFTVSHYRELCQLALRRYHPVTFDAIPWAKRFVLWRHDLDLSLNRGLALANIEREIGLKATYFINPHSEFYNIAEATQHQIVTEILALGHDLGLHFDAAFFHISCEEELDHRIAQEAAYLETLFGRKPVAFSFHNPGATHLACEADHYGGLQNCYSKRLKSEVAYCSDSNGCWRFRRLYDVLAEAKDTCLQVLTHPDWWQDKPMPPRQRVFRSVYGRATANLRAYDAWLKLHNRLNYAGAAISLSMLKVPQPGRFELCDYLWNQGLFQTLFLELWRLHEAQINRLCNAHLHVVWRIPISEVNAFFAEDGLPVDSRKLFSALFELSWFEVADVAHSTYQRWAKILNHLICGRSSALNAELEAECVALCQLMQRLAEWGKEQIIAYDGLANLESIEPQMHKKELNWRVETLESSDVERQLHLQGRWKELKKKFNESECSND